MNTLSNAPINSNKNNTHFHNKTGEQYPSKSLFSVDKLKDFKINDSIGSVGEKEIRSYSSLLLQIQNGITSEYSNSVIYFLVIRDNFSMQHLAKLFGKQKKFDSSQSFPNYAQSFSEKH